MIKLCAVLLAAGFSRRMGTQNKMLLGIDGESMFQHVLTQLVDSDIDKIIVVLGFEKERLIAELKGITSEKVYTAYNPLYKKGLRSSLKAGVERMSGFEPDGVMICLADMPLMSVDDYNLLIKQFRGIYNNTPSIFIPRYELKRGNPVVFSQHFFDEIIDLKENHDIGARELIKKYGEYIHFIEMPNDHCLKDIDTFSDYQNL